MHRDGRQIVKLELPATRWLRESGEGCALPKGAYRIEATAGSLRGGTGFTVADRGPVEVLVEMR